MIRRLKFLFKLNVDSWVFFDAGLFTLILLHFLRTVEIEDTVCIYTVEIEDKNSTHHICNHLVYHGVRGDLG